MYFIGVDVSKDTLDVYIRPEDILLKFANTAKGIQSFLSVLKKYENCLVVFEATGGYEKPLKMSLINKTIEHRVINPGRAREFAKACGRLAKTDSVDAQTLSLFAEKMDYFPSYQHSPEEILLKDLVHRRRQMIEEIVREKNRLDKSFQQIIKQNILSHLDHLQNSMKEIETLTSELIQKVEPLKEKAKIIASMPGIGSTTSSVLLADFPELGSLKNRQIAALAGLAPMNKDSGKTQGYRHIAGGRLSVRCALYMACISAIKSNPLIKPFYKRLREQGKPTKVALVACMRKMITILNQMVMYNNSWQEKNKKVEI